MSFLKDSSRDGVSTWAIFVKNFVSAFLITFGWVMAKFSKEQQKKRGKSLSGGVSQFRVFFVRSYISQFLNPLFPATEMKEEEQRASENFPPSFFWRFVVAKLLRQRALNPLSRLRYYCVRGKATRKLGKDLPKRDESFKSSGRYLYSTSLAFGESAD